MQDDATFANYVTVPSHAVEPDRRGEEASTDQGFTEHNISRPEASREGSQERTKQKHFPPHFKCLRVFTTLQN